MRSQESNFSTLTSQIGHQSSLDSSEFGMPHISKMSPTMLLIMISMAMGGMYLGYQMTHNMFAAIVFGGVAGRIGMWVGMICCSLVAGVEDVLQNIFS